jgi:hypothetical protein
VHDSVASAKAPLLEHYSAVQEHYSACKAQLEEVLTLLSAKAKEDKQIIQILNNLHGLPSLAPASPSCTTPVNHGGDANQIIQNLNILPKRSSFPQVNALPSRTTPVNHGGDAEQIIRNPNILPKCSSFPQVNPEQNIQNPNILPKCHPSFPQGRIDNFDFTHQSNARADGGPPHQGGHCLFPSSRWTCSFFPFRH